MGAHEQVTVDFRRMRAAAVGGEHGITDADLARARPRVAAAHTALAARRAAGELPFFDLPRQDLAPVLTLAHQVRASFENFVLIGIGGSSLGPKATQQALAHPHYNLLDPARRGGPRLFFLENPDPASIAATLEVLDPATTCVNVVTKSGGTAETLANYMLVRGWMERAGVSTRERLIATTDPAAGDLRRLADAEGWRTLPVPPGVGGRFSQLTAVGLFPAAVCGLDVAELLAGAAAMEARTRSGDPEENPAYGLALFQYLADTVKGKHTAVIMPYADGLTYLADWFVQLWAESLGKAQDLDGRTVHAGQTPLPAVGAIDQHSQLQLFVEGPNDKTYTFLKVGRFRHTGEIPRVHGEIPSMGYLGGATLARLLTAEQEATELVLTECGRPSMRIDIPALTPSALGQMFFLFEVMTAFAGGLYHVNPFDQPGVEQGKRYTYGAMGRAGYPNVLAGGKG